MSRYTVRRPHVLGERIDDEIVVVNFENGHYYSLRGVAADVWEMVDSSAAADEIEAALGPRAADGAAGLRSWIDDVLGYLRSESLIAEAPPDAEAPGTPSTTGPLDPPVFERFDDMADLLVLDPVHDVDARGWPHTP